MLKSKIKQLIFSNEKNYNSYLYAKYILFHKFELLYYLYDASLAAKNMRWKKFPAATTDQLIAELLFYYHKIEKAICLPGKKRMFGIDVIRKIITIIHELEHRKINANHSIYAGALSTMHSYLNFIMLEELDKTDLITSEVAHFLSSRIVPDKTFVTPIKLNSDIIANNIDISAFGNLCAIRRSHRRFTNKPIDRSTIENSIRLAQLSPSACNRQPNKVYIINNSNIKNNLLALQNGNSGFGHTSPTVLAITSNIISFFGPTERNQPFIDGGLFCMTLLYALQSHGISSCCLNWCVPPKTDREAHKLLNLNDSERIIMLILIGHPEESTIVPKSHRKSINEIIKYI